MGSFKAALDAVDPRLFWLLVAGFVGIVVALFRKFAPKVFESIPERLQFLPATLVSAIIGAALSGGDPKQAAVDAIVAAVSGGFTSIGIYHVAKKMGEAPPASPGASGTSDPPPPSGRRIVPTTLMALALALSVWIFAALAWAKRWTLPGVAILCLVLVGCLGNGADAPEQSARGRTRGAVLAVALGVHELDVACAQAATALAGDGSDASARASASTLAHTCGDSYRLARASLLTAERAIDSWDDAAAGKVGCAMLEAVKAASRMRLLIGKLVALPAAVNDAIDAAQWLAHVAGSSCGKGS